MTSATDTLRATLDEMAFNALGGLAVNPKPMSGRMMANKLGVSPTTATAAPEKLRDAGFAMSLVLAAGVRRAPDLVQSDESKRFRFHASVPGS